MCFGNTQTTGTTTKTSPSWLTGAANNNLNFVQNLESTGFQPYTGQQVAGFSPQQQNSFDYGQGIAGAVQPNIQLAGGALSDVLTGAGNQPTVNPETISSQMSPYMNQYVNLALQPQLQQAANAYMLQSQAQQGNATSAGAFGDPREAQAQNNLGLNFALQNQGLVGNAYNAAFNTAIGAGAQDVANNLQGQTTNAGLYNTGLNELLAGSNAGYSQGTGAANLLNTYGAQQTAQSQAGLNAQYNQWLMAQQYPFQTAQLYNSTVSAATPGAGSTTTTAAPNNSGWGMVGTLAGTLGGALLGGPVGASIGGSLGGALGGSPSYGGGSPLTGDAYGGSAANPLDGLTAEDYAADGGARESGQPTVIGERGPELFVPKQAGTVIPYETLKAALDKKQPVSTQAFQHDALSQQFGVPAMALGGSFGPPLAAPGSGNMLASQNGAMQAPPVATAPPAPPPAAGMQAPPSVTAAPAPMPTQMPAPSAGGFAPSPQQPQMNPAMMQRFQQFMQQRGGGNPQQMWAQFMQQYGGGNLNNSFGIAA